MQLNSQFIITINKLKFVHRSLLTAANVQYFLLCPKQFSSKSLTICCQYLHISSTDIECNKNAENKDKHILP